MWPSNNDQSNFAQLWSKWVSHLGDQLQTVNLCFSSSARCCSKSLIHVIILKGKVSWMIEAKRNKNHVLQNRTHRLLAGISIFCSNVNPAFFAASITSSRFRTPHAAFLERSERSKFLGGDAGIQNIETSIAEEKARPILQLTDSIPPPSRRSCRVRNT